MRKIILFSILFGVISILNAQHSLTKKSHSVELTGLFSGFYNHQLYKEAFIDSTSGSASLKDLQIQIKGKSKNWFEYELHVDVVDLIDTTINAEDPGLLEAKLTFNTFVDISVGYGRLPYSKSSMVSFFDQVFWNRPTLNRGAFWNRRDAGVSIHKDLGEKINLYAGAYSGYGEQVLKNVANINSNLEYVGRIDFGIPYDSEGIVDLNSSAKPSLGLGLNARYSIIEDIPGEVLGGDLQGVFGLKRQTGTNLGYGLDLSFKYKGFSLLYELHQLSITPLKTNSPLFQGESFSKHNGVVNSGGFFMEAHQYISLAKSIVSIRYQDYNINNLAFGVNKDFTLGIAYQIDGFDAMVKLQFVHVIEEEDLNIGLLENQLRLGGQFRF